MISSAAIVKPAEVAQTAETEVSILRSCFEQIFGTQANAAKKNAFHKQKREWKCTSSSKSENCALTHVLGSDPDKSSHFIGRILKRESKMLRDAHVIVDV